MKSHKRKNYTKDKTLKNYKRKITKVFTKEKKKLYKRKKKLILQKMIISKEKFISLLK